MTRELGREYPELDDPAVFEHMVAMTVAHMEPVSGQLRRGQHAKATGCVTAEFRIANDVPPELRHGIFSQPGRRYSAIVRFSNAQGRSRRTASAPPVAWPSSCWMSPAPAPCRETAIRRRIS